MKPNADEVSARSKIDEAISSAEAVFAGLAEAERLLEEAVAASSEAATLADIAARSGETLMRPDSWLELASMWTAVKKGQNHMRSQLFELKHKSYRHNPMIVHTDQVGMEINQPTDLKCEQT